MKRARRDGETASTEARYRYADALVVAGADWDLIAQHIGAIVWITLLSSASDICVRS